MKFRNLLAVVACGLTLAACGGNNNSQAGNSQTGNSQGGTNAETVKVHTGIGYSASYEAKTEGGQLNVTTAMVAFDATTGKVVKSRIDVVQVTVDVAESGKAIEVTNSGVKVREDGMPKTKLELGADYNMKGASAGVGVINGGAEVDVQIESYAAWTQGKSVQEIKDAMVLVTGDKENGFSDNRAHSHGGVFTTDAALWATCTITVDGFAAAIESAYANKSANAVDVAKDFTVGVGVNAAMYSGNELSVNLGGAIVANGKVAAAAIDEVVCGFEAELDDNRNILSVAATLDADSKYHKGSTDTAQVFKSKKVLKDAYGMASKNSPFGPATLEWYEQAAIVELACAGKTAAEIGSLVKQNTANQETGTVVTGATMNINLYTTAVKRAAEYAQKAGLIGPSTKTQA